MKAKDFIPVYGVVSYFSRYFRKVDKPTLVQQNAAIAMQMYHTFMILLAVVLAMHFIVVP